MSIHRENSQLFFLSSFLARFFKCHDCTCSILKSSAFFCRAEVLTEWKTTLKVNTRGLSISMRRKTLLVKSEKREYRDNWKDEYRDNGKEIKLLRDFLWEKLMTYIKNNCCDYVYVNRRIHLYECLITCQRKSIFEFGLEFLLFFTFILTLLWKHSFKRIIYYKVVSLNHLLMYVMKIACNAFQSSRS